MRDCLFEPLYFLRLKDTLRLRQIDLLKFKTDGISFEISGKNTKCRKKQINIQK